MSDVGTGGSAMVGFTVVVIPSAGVADLTACSISAVVTFGTSTTSMPASVVLNAISS